MLLNPNKDLKQDAKYHTHTQKKFQNIWNGIFKAEQGTQPHKFERN